MPYTNHQSYLAALERAGELQRVTVPVSPELEITEIATRAVREERPSLLFENVEGSRFPLSINTMASARRIELALGMHPSEIGEQLVGFVERVNPPSLKALWRERSTVRRLLKARPKRVRRVPVQEVVEDSPNLFDMPVLKCWPGDGGRFITLPLVASRDPETGVGNLGIYRMHVYDERTTGMHMQIMKGGGYHHYAAEKMGRPLEMAVALGGDPALLLAAVMPLPEGLDEVAFSGLLRDRRTPVAGGRTVDVPVPAEAEFVLEGIVPSGERRLEGPFGDHFGHYSDAADFPVFRVRTITRRRNPVYPGAVVGKPPQEDRFLGDAAQQALVPLIRLIHPEIRDMWAYYEAGFHHLLVVAVESRFTREHLKTALGLLGQGQLALTKALVLVDPDVDVKSPSEVLQAIRRNFEPREDFLLIARAPADTLDFTPREWHRGSKMVIDATGDSPPAGRAAALPADLRAVAPEATSWRLVGQALLAVRVSRNARAAVEALVASPLLQQVKIVAVVSEDVDIDDAVELLWGIFTRFDPAQDVVFTEMRMDGALPVYSGVMGIDASFKEGYPAPLEMTPEIVEKVEARWDEYWR